MSTSIYIYIIGESETTIWGLSGRERLQRMLKPIEQAILVDDVEKIPNDASVLLLCADHLYDARVLTALIAMQEKAVLYSNDGEQVAIRTNSNEVSRILKVFLNGGHVHTVSTISRYNLEDLKIDFEQFLKKKDSPYILPINKANRKQLESELFNGSYKGVTDLVTKWCWPVPAFWATHFCIRHDWEPNHVTLLSYVFAFLAGFSFYFGYYGAGLMMGWFMTFLDTVDGKLARVTVTSSRLGDVLDHGLDLVHPPLWYMAWGAGLASTLTPIDHTQLLIWLMFFGYIGGRLCEGVFEFWLAPFSIFVWRQWDSFNRLITARRNPNLILLTYGWIIDRPDLGFVMMVLWHLLSTGILGWRLLVGWRVKRGQGELQSWLQDIDPSRDREILAVKIFTREPFQLKKL